MKKYIISALTTSKQVVYLKDTEQWVEFVQADVYNEDAAIFLMNFFVDECNLAVRYTEAIVDDQYTVMTFKQVKYKFEELDQAYLNIQ